MRNKVAVAEFVSAQNNGRVMNRGKTAHAVNATLWPPSKYGEASLVAFNCSQCDHSNLQHWFGREYHVCEACDAAISIDV